MRRYILTTQIKFPEPQKLPRPQVNVRAPKPQSLFIKPQIHLFYPQRLKQFLSNPFCKFRLTLGSWEFGWDVEDAVEDRDEDVGGSARVVEMGAGFVLEGEGSGEVCCVVL